MPRRDVALAVLVAAVWGVNFTVIRVGLDSVPPLLLSALRYALAAFPLVLLLGRPQVPWRGIVAVGVVLARIELSDQEQFLIGGHRRFESSNRLLAADEKGNDALRKNDDIAQRQDWEQACHMSAYMGGTRFRRNKGREQSR